VTAAAMIGIQAVTPQLIYIDDRTFCMGQFHQVVLRSAL
jgi:hypothetical protein